MKSCRIGLHRIPGWNMNKVPFSHPVTNRCREIPVQDEVRQDTCQTPGSESGLEVTGRSESSAKALTQSTTVLQKGGVQACVSPV